MQTPVDVVLVDDVPDVLRLLRTALRFRGRFEVVGEAATGAEALAVIERLQPRVVVLDLGLPDLSGQRLLGRVREAAPYAKVVIFSGRALDDAEWFASRSAGYVHKGQLDLLVETLEAVTTPPSTASSALSLPADRISVALVREHVRRQVARWSMEHLTDDALVVASELAANAIEHGRTAFDLRVGLRDGRVLRVEVADHGGGSPEIAAPAATSERGRGLFIVSALSESWGIQALEGGGKAVWAELVDRNLP